MLTFSPTVIALLRRIDGTFPRPAQCDRHHAWLLRRAGMIERAKMFRSITATGSDSYSIYIISAAGRQFLHDLDKEAAP